MALPRTGILLLAAAAALSVLGLGAQRCAARKSSDEVANKNLTVSLVSLSQYRMGHGISNGRLVGPPRIPVVVWHGMGDTAINQDYLASSIHRLYPGTRVLAVQVGSSEEEDSNAGIWGDVDSQVEQACKAILDNEMVRLVKKVNFLGLSQGALFTRALIERCPLEEHSIEVHNFVSIGGPQQGVYGVPKDLAKGKMSSYLLTSGASMFAYKSYFQRNCVPAVYWHNPKNKSAYRKKTLLADINNEGPTFHEDYKRRFSSLNRLVLVKFNEDSMVTPAESSHFGFYREGSGRHIEPMTETTLYKNDLIGLRHLKESQRVDLIEVDADHMDFEIKWFRETIVLPYLNSQ